jgi:hypothetical protein
MKDIVIPSKTVKKELVILFVSLAAALILNIYSIIKYKTSWTELFSQLHVVLAVGLVIYLLVSFFRLIFAAFNRLLSKKQH